MIYPIPSEEQWVKTSFVPLDPPTVKKQPRRPKKNRKKGADEPKKQHGVRVRFHSVSCSNYA